ncbi:ribonuclease H-like domain-containing protein [Clostridium bowmanii]|uniref:ribonuclease H-like domain-containing protein n=1 Tax=Clostridium bowmanii TaxID=132925 RepID=UPI001C0BD9B1|nr:ribonuclease H-like domain-containing protein [Clostridium bowmanii]MBU3189477.1 ribonuclease H-like domain-containing protein [Clostridium bowmanii]MCA1074091.1 ribonuclease H-like domain-containing protein [Clostridium bowmanii]
MITKLSSVKVGEICTEGSLTIDGNKQLFKDALFFDLEHYIYKKPICIGVFGCCVYDEITNELKVTQYMAENKKDAIEILSLAKNYFEEMKIKYNKKYIVTFSGNNDFTVINYLLKAHKTDFILEGYFGEIDLQKCYEKAEGSCIGLKALEKIFDIDRESELISGSNLAKTFGKIVKDDDYINRMPQEKKDKILLYNQQDVVSLFYIYIDWYNRIELKKEEITAQ